MQYKFFVDGEWRHDDLQPCESGEYGIVNTVSLATDPNILPVLTPDIVSGSNMDVDNEAFRRMVRVSHTLAVVIAVMSVTSLCMLTSGFVLWIEISKNSFHTIIYWETVLQLILELLHPCYF